MNQSLNLLIIIAIISFVLFLFFMKFTQAQSEQRLLNKKNKTINKLDYTFSALEKFIAKRLLEITTSNLLDRDLTEEEYNRKKRRRKELKEALRKCNTGDSSSRAFIKSYINDLLVTEKGVDENTVNFAIPFNTPSNMTSEEKFTTILHIVEKKEGKKALIKLIEKFGCDKPKEDGGYRVTAKEVDDMYSKIIGKGTIPLNDKLEIITQLIYSYYKGFGVIDYIREMAIDGVSGGVSGMPDNPKDVFEAEEFHDFVETYGLSTTLESVWIMAKGKKIHLSFLSFKSVSELRRVVTNVYKHGYPGQLSETKPAIISDMADGSRVTVIRPKLSETWAFFIRKKYSMKRVELDELVVHENSTIVIKLLELLIKAKQNLAITGGQGSGKTTLLMALVRHINAALSLRVQETKFELNLRRPFPNRNILSFQETDSYSGQEALDLQKKTDGDVTILGEVATNPVAVWMIQTAQVASRFTLFTHHAKSFKELVFSLRNALLNENMFNNERVSEQQVVSVLGFNVHLEQNEETGERYIAHVTECIPNFYGDDEKDAEEFQNLTDEESKKAFLIKMQTKYYLQQTQTKQFIENTVLEYRDGKYVPVNPISEKRMESILKELKKEDQEVLTYLMQEVWGA